MWCIVNLPNGTQQAVKWDPKAIGQECLEKVCKALGIICEMEYFGLEHWTPNQKESRTRQWINLRNRLSCDSGSSSSGIQLMLALRVKFWVPVHFILQESVRNLFYMQARVDLLEGRLSAHDWSNAAKLAALLCQADGLRFNEQSLQAECPMRMRREHERLRQQQQQQQQAQQLKERKEKDHVLSLKKRRLSKQKSVEHIDVPQAIGTALSSSYGASSYLASQSYSLSAPSSSTVTGNSHPASNSSASPSPSAGSSSLAANSSSTSTSPSNTSNLLAQVQSQPQPQTQAQAQQGLEERLAANPLRIYENYLILPVSEYGTEPPEDFLHQIAVEHSKLAKLKMIPKSAKYWLLQEIQELSGYGEELFSGVTTNESATRCDIAVGAHGITVSRGEDKQSIPFSAIAAAKSLRRTFKLEYVDDHNDRKDLEIKLPKQPIAAGLYRSITERHAFYVCDKVRGVVTNQFTRDLKGTIASMFKEDTELGKRYVFDIQHTCREVHDQARRILHERGVELTAHALAGGDGGAAAVDSAVIGAVAGGGAASNGFGLDATCVSSMAGKIDLAIREKEEREAAIERCVDSRISEAMTCKICMDRAINTMFNPCCHVIACAECAARCNNCPNCRVKITSVVKIYLPPELRTSQSGSSSTDDSADSGHALQADNSPAGVDDSVPSTSSSATGAAAPGAPPKVTTAA
ncbi:E3 ubiquitin-protein ligase MYLIP [Scaptodrosophila lebanonensis]|uniref:RING-type E3 ubiquitin transferase n=1 Tax=Drosophila lebanonensis TaxID=7225 RepID=A0A6J2TC80_DROLE|nr:E3 ubiquitin-protein ligase MYLIP [Scaptodrosophila lebanonensis]